MKLWSLLGNGQRLDGGAMFGNVPRALWSRWYEPDEDHRIDLACRAMLICDEQGRNILFETGIGAFFEPKLKSRFGVQSDRHLLLENLEAIGRKPSDIDMVVLSHLHFDHAGGLLTAWSENGEPELCFSNAAYFVSEGAWQRACAPHARDKASFIPVLNHLLEKSGRLRIVTGERNHELGECFRFHYSDGHTPSMMLTEVATHRGPLVFAGDLIPGAAWVHLPITMGYDRFPERIIDEKTILLEDLHQRNGSLFFTHDPTLAMGKVVRSESGRFELCEEFDDSALQGVAL